MLVKDVTIICIASYYLITLLNKQTDMTNHIAKLLKEHKAEELIFAYKVGVSIQTVWRWKTRKSHPKSEQLILISKFFDCSLDEIIE